MTEDVILSTAEVRSVALRVLSVERALLRRAWGILYGIIALEVFVRVLLPSTLYELGYSALFNFWTSLAINTLVPLLALAVAIWILRRVFALHYLRKSITGSFWTLIIRPLPALVIFALALAGILTAYVLLNSDFFVILLGFYAAQIPLFYFTLRACFPEGLPREGGVALLAYGIATIGDFVVSLSSFASDVSLYFLLGGIEFLGFLAAFVYSRSVTLSETPMEASENW